MADGLRIPALSIRVLVSLEQGGLPAHFRDCGASANLLPLDPLGMLAGSLDLRDRDDLVPIPLPAQVHDALDEPRAHEFIPRRNERFERAAEHGDVLPLVRFTNTVFCQLAHHLIEPLRRR